MITFSEIQVQPEDGLQETINQMYLLESKALQNLNFKRWAHSFFQSHCIACYPGEIWKYMRRYFLFVNDTPHDEVIIAPYLMPSLRRGDCDDFALFSKTVLDILGGWKTSYILFGRERDQFTHIATYATRLNDVVIIDGASKIFNDYPEKYNWYKIL